MWASKTLSVRGPWSFKVICNPDLHTHTTTIHHGTIYSTYIPIFPINKKNGNSTIHKLNVRQVKEANKSPMGFIACKK